MNKNLHTSHSSEIYKDPVCDMDVSIQSKFKSMYKGDHYYFCSDFCLKKFKTNPNQFLLKKTNPNLNSSDQNKLKYTCPMHPEIVQFGPGFCPKCGMSLELLSASSEETDSTEYRLMFKHFLISSLFTVPLFFVSMGGMIFENITSFIPKNYKGITELILASPICIWSALPFYKRAINSILNKSLNMFTLIGLGVGVSFLYSTIAVLFPTIFPHAFKNHEGNVDLYFESAGFIVTLILLGQVLELKARNQTSNAIKKLLGLAVKNAKLIQSDGIEIDIPLENVKIGDYLRVRPGEKIPVDGVIIEGSSFIDESMVTGESIPLKKQIGEKIIGATINGNGSLVMRAEKVGADMLLSRIVSMVADAQRSRAQIQKLADLVSSYFVPTVIMTSILTFIIWGLIGPTPKLVYAFINSIAVVIIACPCALGLATPMSIMVATGKAAISGVLFRNAEAIESMCEIDTLVVDKTGTLTKGFPEVVSIKSFDFDKNEILRYAASLEKNSEHPIGSAILRKTNEFKISVPNPKSFESITGKGIKGTVDEKNIILGNQLFMKDSGMDTSSFMEYFENLSKEGQTVLFISVNNKISGMIGIADPIKETTHDAIDLLHREKIRIVMLTGDNKFTAQTVANKLKIDEVIAEVLPDQKATIIQKFQKMGKIVAMAGDGINDAPALAQANIGIAMGNGTDIAMESAHVTLVKGDLLGIVKAKKLSRNVMQNIKQNLFFAFFYNILGIPIAAGILYPFFGLLLSPIFAAIAMSFSSLSVILNSLRIKYIKL